MEEDTQQNSAPAREQSENGSLDGDRQAGIITIVFTANNRLGHAAFSQNPRKREEGRQRLRRAFQQVTDFAVGQGVDLFVQAGNLFDTPGPDEEDRSFVAERLAQLRQAGIRTFALGGIRDTPANAFAAQQSDNPAAHALPPQISYARLGALHYFPPAGSSRNTDGPKARGAYLEPVMVNVRGTLLALCGLGTLPDQEEDPLAHLSVDSDIERAAISLLVLHAPIAAALTDSQNEPEERPHNAHDRPGLTASVPASASSASIANQTTFRYILAGYHPDYHHVHIGQTDVIVAGATQRIDFSEPDDDPGFVFLGIAADGICWCRHIPVDALKLRRLSIDTAELWPQDADSGDTSITDLVLQGLEPLCKADTLVQLRLTGEVTRSQYHQLDLNKVRHFGEELCFALAIDDSGLSFVPGASALAAGEADAGKVEERLSPREELVTLADEWIAAAQDEQERQALQITKEELLAAFSSGVNT